MAAPMATGSLLREAGRDRVFAAHWRVDPEAFIEGVRGVRARLGGWFVSSDLILATC